MLGRDELRNGHITARGVLVALDMIGEGMGSLHDARNRLVDAQGSIGERRRSKRWDWFAKTFTDIESMSVIDLGGTAEAWRRAPVRPASLHIINLELESAEVPAWIRVDRADACDLPAHIASRRYDLVFSNSVIEHVGGHSQRQHFADTIHTLADRHWVQTPYRYFPIEPHWLFPGFQFLPLSARAGISRHWPLAHSPSKGREESVQQAMSVELLSRTEMAFYFPGSMIGSERILGIVKSLVAIKVS
jgi:hypothetical protein